MKATRGSKNTKARLERWAALKKHTFRRRLLHICPTMRQSTLTILQE